jgi:hypothetical protein
LTFSFVIIESKKREKAATWEMVGDLALINLR